VQLSLVSKVKSILIKSLELVSREAVIRLKGFLKEYYQLTNERCLHYNPEDKFIAEKSKFNSSVNKFIAFHAELNFNVYSSFLFDHNEEEIMKDKNSLKKIIRYSNTMIVLYKVLYIIDSYIMYYHIIDWFWLTTIESDIYWTTSLKIFQSVIPQLLRKLKPENQLSIIIIKS
jgi:hypothetical protein